MGIHTPSFMQGEDKHAADVVNLVVVVVIVGGGGVVDVDVTVVVFGVVAVVVVVVLFIVEVVGVVVLVVNAGSWVVFPCCGQRPQYLGQASFPRSLRQGSMGRSRHSRSIIWSLQTCTSGSK